MPDISGVNSIVAPPMSAARLNLYDLTREQLRALNPDLVFLQVSTWHS